MLKGYWQDSTGRRRPFVLRENYAQAVRYEIQPLTLWGGKGGDEYTCLVPHYKRDYLRLLDSVPPVLRQRQAPSMAKRRRQMRADVATDEDSEYAIAVRLNGFNLLSYQTEYTGSPFRGRPQYNSTTTLIDLASGRLLTVTSQLRPHYQMPLRHLLAEHLLHDVEFDYINKGHAGPWMWADSTRSAVPDTMSNKYLWKWRQFAPLSSNDVMVLTSEGLEIDYWLGSLITSGGFNEDHAVLVPYRELRPLVRPGTPLARMLQARGIW